MKYNEYMDLFTVSPEVKSSVFNKIKQHNKQTHQTENKTEIVTFAPKKNNTFKLHPKRWIAIATSIVLVAVLTPIIYFSVPRNNFEDNSLSLDYMKNLMVDVEGITAYSIRKETKSINSEASVKTAKAASVSLLSATLIDGNGKDNDNNSDGTKHNYYLYSTSENYEYGNVEYDSKGIQRVTFIKNTEVIEDVYDKNGDLIDSNRKITQDELDAQINKIFTTKQYTYIQFVPLVESAGEYPYKDTNGNIQYEHVDLRPDSMVYDEYGVSEFDTTGYFSNNLTASFVIDNSTGYIYKIENLYIKEFVNGLVKDDNGNYYSISTDFEHNIVFTDLVPNKDIEVYNVFLDNYGWTLVINSELSYKDSAKKIIYSTINNSEWLYDSDGNIYLWSNYDFIGPYVADKMVNGEWVEFENTGIIKGLKQLVADIPPSAIPVGMYKNFSLYSFSSYLAYNSKKHCGIIVPNAVCYWLDDNYDTVIASYSGGLYYKKINLNDYLEIEDTFITLEVITEDEIKQFIYLGYGLNRLEEDYYMTVGEDKYKVNNVFYNIGLNKTTYYRILKTATGVELVEITSKSYTDNVFIFQPINK